MADSKRFNVHTQFYWVIQMNLHCPLRLEHPSVSRAIKRSHPAPLSLSVFVFRQYNCGLYNMVSGSILYHHYETQCNQCHNSIRTCCHLLLSNIAALTTTNKLDKADSQRSKHRGFCLTGKFFFS